MSRNIVFLSCVQVFQSSLLGWIILQEEEKLKKITWGKTDVLSDELNLRKIFLTALGFLLTFMSNLSQK